MRKISKREVFACDGCGTEQDYIDRCIGCGTEHCWRCMENKGRKYPHAVYCSGSGDGYYCAECDAKTKDGESPILDAYREIQRLRNECEAWGKDFQTRQRAAEARLEEVRQSK